MMREQRPVISSITVWVQMDIRVQRDVSDGAYEQVCDVQDADYDQISDTNMIYDALRREMSYA